MTSHLEVIGIGLLAAIPLFFLCGLVDGLLRRER